MTTSRDAAKRKKNVKTNHASLSGTGTQAGDPREASAIKQAFFPGTDTRSEVYPKLYVGSIKTVIGHTEGCAGIAGLLKAALALKNSIIPPNQHFHNLNSSVAPSYANLCVPTSPTPWPSPSPSIPRRASVNSFGFGGTNAHAIVEAYDAEAHNIDAWGPQEKERVCSAEISSVAGHELTPLPITLSATSNTALVGLVAKYVGYLDSDKGRSHSLHQIAATLQNHRSSLPFRAIFAGPSREQLRKEMTAALKTAKETKADIGKRLNQPPAPGDVKILGVFTGQGAQWPAMGASLLVNSQHFRDTIAKLDASLQALPDAPEWTLYQELTASAGSSRVGEAAISQPACTALQVALVDLLRTANISFHTVIGHSSGEIGAAYTAGFISGTDAVRIAYYRGVHAKSARGRDGQKGSMIAVGWGIDEAREFCSTEPRLNGRLGVAASNSPGSVTLSGNEKAVQIAKELLDAEGVFNRVLQVDTAYHSHHMIPCAQGYLDSLKACDIQVQNPGSGCTWISSVRNGSSMSFAADEESLRGTYWRDNMVQAVLFSQAVQGALASSLSSGGFSMALEVGPHPALKGPVLQTIKHATDETLLYEGVLDRKRDDVAAFASAVGSAASSLSADFVNLDSYANAFFSEPGSAPVALLPCAPVSGLPAYAWDHRLLWRESRLNKQLRSRAEPPHELLGVRTTDDSEHEPRWRNILTTDEVPWIRDHRIQGQIVLPAAMYCAMALEAAASLSRSRGDGVRSIEVLDLEISRATAIDDASEGCETIFSLHSIETPSKQNSVLARFSISTGAIKGGIMRQVCRGSIRIQTVSTHEQRTTHICARRDPSPDYLLPMSVDRFYSALGELGLNYTGAFRAISSLERTLDRASAVVAVGEQHASAVIHPSWLDVSFQTVFAAFAATHDGSLWSAFVPTRFGSVKLVVAQPDVPVESLSDLVIDSEINSFETAMQTSAKPKITADIAIFDSRSGAPRVFIQDMTMTALAPSTVKDDRHIFQRTIWQQDILSGVDFQVPAVGHVPGEQETIELSEQLAAYLLKSIASADDRFIHLRDQILSAAQYDEKEHTLWRDLKLDSIVRKLIAKAAKILADAGDKRASQGLVQYQLTQVDESFDSLLGQWHNDFNVAKELVQNIEQVVSQIAHKHPRMRILQLGPWPASDAVSRLIATLGDRFASLTIVDDGESNEVKEISIRDKRVTVVASDSDVLANSATFDLVLISDPFKAIEQLQNARQLIKSGGFLVLAVPDSRSVYANFLQAAISWNGRREVDSTAALSAPLTLSRIHKLLRNGGFTGITASSERADMISVASLIVSQATDPTMSSLFQPLHRSSANNDFCEGDLVVIGGSSSIETILFAESLIARLATVWKGTISQVEDFTETSIGTLSTAALVISLAELDEPIFKNLDEAGFYKLQKFFKSCKTIQYIINTSSAVGSYHSALVGFGRSVAIEDPELMLQFLDVDRLQSSETVIAEAALRLAASRHLAKDPSVSSRLWTNELELAARDGKLLIPRVVLDRKRNDAVNSVRRVVEYDVSTKDAPVSLAKAGTHFIATQATTAAAPLAEDMESSSLVQVDLCVKSSVVTGNGGSEKYLGFGSTEDGHKVMVVIPENTSCARVSTENLVVLRENTQFDNQALVARVLVGVYYSLQSEIIVSRLPRRYRVLLPILDSHLASTIETYLDRELDVDLILFKFTSSGSSKIIERTANTITMRNDVSRSQMAEVMMRENIEILVDYGLSCESDSHYSAVATLLSAAKDVGIRAVAFEDIYGAADSVKLLLSKLFADVARLPKFSDEAVLVVKAADAVASSDAELRDVSKTVVVDWSTSQNIRVRAQPHNPNKPFSSRKAYLLVGLSGQMGQSICRWMVQHGARHLVVTSRNPQRDGDWIADLEAYGAQIDIRAADVTSKKEITALVASISAQTLEVGGVMNGAMLLADGVFANMSFASMAKVLRPKIAGSEILDQVLGDADLDFFIMLSSVNAATGMAGQSNYTAANMVSLTNPG